MPLIEMLGGLREYNDSGQRAYDDRRREENVAIDQRRLLDGSAEDLVDYWGKVGPRRQAVRESIRPEDIYNRFILPDLQRGMQRDLQGIRSQGEQSIAANRSRNKDLARGYGAGGARYSAALDAGLRDATNLGTSQALAQRRQAFLSEALDPANMGLLRELNELERKRRADQQLAASIGLGFLGSGMKMGQQVGGDALNAGLDAWWNGDTRGMRQYGYNPGDGDQIRPGASGEEIWGTGSGG